MAVHRTFIRDTGRVRLYPGTSLSSTRREGSPRTAISKGRSKIRAAALNGYQIKVSSLASLDKEATVRFRLSGQFPSEHGRERAVSFRDERTNLVHGTARLCD